MADAFDPEALARAVAIDTAEDADHVGDFVTSIASSDGVTDFRFVATMVGYEGWQWSVTLFHDVDDDRWTVDEATLIPTDKALLPPTWVPWKDRLEPSDLSVTDAIGTEPDDPRLEPGMDESETETVTMTVSGDGATTDEEDLHDAVEEFDLSRRSVMSPLGRAQTAQRWYDGPHGPKSLSTKTADGNTCSTCGFFIQLRGELSEMFGVCANRWSPDDGRVVSLDHGCGEHSQIEPPEPSHLWIQTKPAYDDVHIDIVAQIPREERGDVELIETVVDAKRHDGAHDGTKSATDVADDEDTVDVVDTAGDTDNTDNTDNTDTVDITDTSHDGDETIDADVQMATDDAQTRAADDTISDEPRAAHDEKVDETSLTDAADDVVTNEEREAIAASDAEGDETEDTVGETQIVAELTTDAEEQGEDFQESLEAKADGDATADGDAAAAADAAEVPPVRPYEEAHD